MALEDGKKICSKDLLEAFGVNIRYELKPE